MPRIIATSDYPLFTRTSNGQYIMTLINERKRNKKYMMMQSLGMLKQCQTKPYDSITKKESFPKLQNQKIEFLPSVFLFFALKTLAINIPQRKKNKSLIIRRHIWYYAFLMSLLILLTKS